MKQENTATGAWAGLPLHSRDWSSTSRGLALLFLLLAAKMVLTSPALAASDPEQPLHTFPALLGVEIQIDSDGSLQFIDQNTDAPLLRGSVPVVPRSRANRSGSGDVFTARAPEGIQGGRRGEPTRADDDGDGRVDEDPLDGRDNDGDGHVDEDFAAISDAMVVVDIGGGAKHVEFYHWAYSHLMSAAFFSLSGEPDPAGISDFCFVAPGGEWSEAELFNRRHSMTGRPCLDQCKAQVAKVSLPGSESAEFWVGILVFEGVSDSPAQVVMDRDRLDILHQGKVSAVACVAESWLQLNRLLCESRRVYEGVLDPMTGDRTPWIVSPLCSVCRRAKTPEFSWSVANGEDLLLNIAMEEGGIGLVDPDLFTLGEVTLGFPVEIIWKPDGAEVQRERWTRMTPGLLGGPVKGLSDPYGKFTTLLGHGAAGQLTFRFILSPEDPGWNDLVVSEMELSSELQLRGRWLDGRNLQAPAKAIPGTFSGATFGVGDLAGSMTPSEATPAPDQESGCLSLAPELLQGWPNPFRESIQVRFTVPQNQGEAFEWDKSLELSSGIEMQAPVSWEAGSPFVTIKIYRINGQELVTLHQDYSSHGETTVQWDGNDLFGRPVASGPYFCKLQMDEWSVTQRIVFLR
ncbi:MAG: hypothetical protein KOO60_02530 [Gemmatimonadales bacterium]|nr:hypothetical protein [Gemmatimonadales bacterium]